MRVCGVGTISIHDTPADMADKLAKCDLSLLPRDELVVLLKYVDQKIERRSALDFGWYRPWIILIQFLDPTARLAWPDPDWSVLDD